MQTPEPSTPPGGDRRRYRPPALTVFGAAVAVTAGGSAPVYNEPQGISYTTSCDPAPTFGEDRCFNRP